MVPFESLHAVSYLPSVVTVALSCVSSEIKPDIGRKSRFFIPSLHSTPPLGGGSRRNIAIPFGVEKLEWRGYPTVKKTVRAMHTRRAVKTGHKTQNYPGIPSGRRQRVERHSNYPGIPSGRCQRVERHSNYPGISSGRRQRVERPSIRCHICTVTHGIQDCSLLLLVPAHLDMTCGGVMKGGGAVAPGRRTIWVKNFGGNVSGQP